MIIGELNLFTGVLISP